jgi:hypothetical protein
MSSRIVPNSRDNGSVIIRSEHCRTRYDRRCTSFASKSQTFSILPTVDGNPWVERYLRAELPQLPDVAAFPL